MLKVLDLFSGIGGFSLGLERTGGFQTAAFCEIDPFCRAVLAKHWPGVPVFEDVRSLDYDGPVDVITGGYPCQPFSHAGKRQGAADDRHLWPSMFRLIEKHRPAWVIGENVAGHISMGIDAVLSDLEGACYAARPFVIPACAVDAQHRRDRVWIVAHAAGDRRGKGGTRKLAGSSEDVANAESVARRAGIGKESEDRQEPCHGGNVSNASRQRCGEEGEYSRRQEKRIARSGETKFRRWPIEPAVGRVAHGVPRRVDRLRALGNAVVPQIPEMIGYAILQAEQPPMDGGGKRS